MRAEAPATASGDAARPTTRPGALVAVLAKRGRFLAAQPIFERGGQVSIDARGRHEAGPGDLVVIGAGKRGLRVSSVLGRPDVARDVLEGLMLSRGLSRRFDRSVDLEAREAADAVQRGDFDREGRRLDLTGLPTFTIDPASARDFDDAISARREDDGSVRVWVHIADVSALVRPGGAIEREAYRRATSVYVPGTVEPMLPAPLSSDANSLRPATDRLAVTVEMEMRGADVASVRFHRSLIRSDMRLTYDEVDEIFAGTRRAEAPWGEPLEAARAVAAALRERRASRGSLEVSSSEPSFTFDRGGHVTGVHQEAQTESHTLIEELMILANEQVAGYLSERRLPTLYRVHERPTPESILFLLDQLGTLDVPTPIAVPDQPTPQQAAALAGEISRHVAAHVRRTGRGRGALPSLVLRALKQAYYSPRNVGHAGLQSPRYCHFTSPIRRYPDLVAHRALLAGLGIDDVPPRADDMEAAGAASSGAERAAMKIERDADDVCLCFLLERELGRRGLDASFEGEVVGLVGAGAFVRFGPSGYEGFLPVRRMRGDWWELNEEGTILRGTRNGGAVRLGDPVEVKVERIEAPRGRVDLVPAGEELD